MWPGQVSGQNKNKKRWALFLFVFWARVLAAQRGFRGFNRREGRWEVFFPTRPGGNKGGGLTHRPEFHAFQLGRWRFVEGCSRCGKKPPNARQLLGTFLVSRGVGGGGGINSDGKGKPPLGGLCVNSEGFKGGKIVGTQPRCKTSIGLCVGLRKKLEYGLGGLVGSKSSRVRKSRDCT